MTAAERKAELLQVVKELDVPIQKSVSELLDRIVFLEEQGYTPYCRSSNEGIYDPADNRTHTAEKECYEIKLEDTDESPVDAADDKQRQSDLVPHMKYLLSELSALCKTIIDPTAGFIQSFF